MEIKVQRRSSTAIVLFLVIMVVMLLAAFPGCRGKGQSSGTITLYTSVPTAIIEELKQEFEAENPGMYLQIYRKGTSAVVEKINEEIAAGQVQADVIWVANFAVGEELKNAGQLLKYESPQAAEIMPILKDKDGYYCAARLLNMIIAYNTDSVKEKPTSYRDLLDPAYKGKIGLAAPAYSGSTLYTVASLVQSEELTLNPGGITI